jgi:minor extracellular serine protease Vpr
MLKRLTITILLMIFLASSLPVHSSAKDRDQVALLSLKEGSIRQVLHLIKQDYPNVKIRHRFTETFYGISVAGSLQDLTQLTKIPSVNEMHFVTTYSAHLEESVPFVGANQAKKLKDAKGRMVTGEGIKVGIIDTGIDYNHPDLKRNYAGGYDTIDLDKDPMETKQEDLSTFHGTHVAGVIAANGKQKGVAPKAKLYIYRALGPGGYGTTETVIAAIERAVKDRVDILNLSLGNDVNGPDWPTSIALNKVDEKGILAITAAGNSGPALWSVGSPATSSKALSVGASYPPLYFPSILINGKEKIITPMVGTPKWKPNLKFRIVDGGLGEKGDLKRVKNKIVLIQRGKITFSDKVKNAQIKGAKGVIVYNNEDGNFAGKVKGEFKIPAATISKKNGEWLKELINKKKRYIQIDKEKKVDVLASFSSRGPVTGTWQMKPDLVAPGVEIKSTIPGGYLSLQGTSMASPHVAGAAALLKQLHPNWTPNDLKSALVNTAIPLYRNKKSLYHAYEQGAGRLNINNALKTETLVYPTSLSLGVTKNNQGNVQKSFRVKIKNTSGAKKHVVLTQSNVTKGIQWILPTNLTLPPYSSKMIEVRAMIQTKQLKDGFYDGALSIVTDTEKLRVPFLLLQGEPNFPSVMGFHFGKVKGTNKYKYELYLPSKVEEYKIAVFEAETFRFVSIIDEQKNSRRGIIKKELILSNFPKKGVYKFVIFYKRKQYESAIESYVNVAKTYVEE